MWRLSKSGKSSETVLKVILPTRVIYGKKKTEEKKLKENEFDSTM